jgi:oligosaccharide repeat unit polymerase
VRLARIAWLAALLGVVLLLPGAGGALGAACVWALCLTILVRSHPNGILSLSALYLLLLGVFHLGLVVPVALGLTQGTPPAWLRSPQLGTALGLFSVATAAFTLGARAHAQPIARRDTHPLEPQRELLWVGCLVAALGGTLLWVGVMQLGLLSAGYDSFFERHMTQDTRNFLFGLMLFPMGVLVAAVGATPRQMFALGALVAIVLAPLFLTGFRGPVIVQMASLLAVWTWKDRRTARRLAVAGVLLAMLLAPAIRASRDLEREFRIEAFDPFEVLTEAGGSLYPLIVTAEAVEPGSEPLWMGRSYAAAVRRIVPNVSAHWAAPPARALTPSAWATLRADPWVFDHGGGIGFSGIAEPYLNFGVAGVVLVFLLLGLVIQWWDRSLGGGSPFLAAVGAAAFGFVLWTVRNEATELLRAIAYAAAAVFGAWILSRALRRRRRDTPDTQAAPLEPDGAGPAPT